MRRTIERRVIDHLFWVPHVVGRLRIPVHVDRQDLIAVGNLALVQTAMRYNPKNPGGASFATYAEHRIKGAVLDECRRLAENRRRRTGVKISYTTDIDLDTFETLQPASDVLRASLIKRQLDQLPLRIRRVLVSHYYADRPISETAKRMGISETRGHQLHHEGLRMLRRNLPEVGRLL